MKSIAFKCKRCEREVTSPKITYKPHRQGFCSGRCRKQRNNSVKSRWSNEQTAPMLKRIVSRYKRETIGRTAKDFYQTSAWLHLRFLAFQAFGRKCMCCGRTSMETDLHVDHIRPVSLFPDLKLSLDNLQVLCADCNVGKSNLFEVDLRTEEQKTIIRRRKG